MGCNLIVKSLLRSRKHIAGTSLGKENDCVAQVGDITLNQTWLRQRSTFSVVAPSRRMHLRFGNIDRVSPLHRVAQALGKEAENPACRSA